MPSYYSDQLRLTDFLFNNKIVLTEYFTLRTNILVLSVDIVKLHSFIKKKEAYRLQKIFVYNWDKKFTYLNAFISASKYISASSMEILSVDDSGESLR